MHILHCKIRHVIPAHYFLTFSKDFRMPLCVLSFKLKTHKEPIRGSWFGFIIHVYAAETH